MPKGQRHPGYGIVFFPALQQDTTQLASGPGASTVLFTDAGSGKETFIGSGASAVLFTDAGAGKETFTGTGASAVRFTDAGAGLEKFIGSGASSVAFTDAGIGIAIIPISASGASVVPFVDGGSAAITNPRVFFSDSAPGGGGPPRSSRAKKRKVIDRPLRWEPWSPAPESPTQVGPDRVLPRAPILGSLEQRELSLDPVLGPALQRQRAADRQAAWHENNDVTGNGDSTLQCSSTGRGRVIPADMMSALRQLAEF